MRTRLERGFGIRSTIRRQLAGRPPAGELLGEMSRFAPGSWVRVIDESRLRATLDERSRLRGLAFVPTQWDSCGQVYRVEQHVRRIRDDKGRFRPVARTVLLEGVSCAGKGPGPAGCGRHFPLMFRDEWLEPARAPRQGPPAASTARHARVRELEEIVAGLDLHGRRGGVTFMPEMAAHAGRRFAILEHLPQVFEHDRWVAPRAPIYLLEGLHCGGTAAAGAAGPCHRACTLMWHEDWLILEPETRPTHEEGTLRVWWAPKSTQRPRRMFSQCQVPSYPFGHASLVAHARIGTSSRRARQERITGCKVRPGTRHAAKYQML